MKFDAGYTPSFVLKPEDTQNTVWLDKFVRGLYAETTNKKTMKMIDKMFIVRVKDCVRADGESIDHCTVSEYAQKGGLGEGAYAEELEFTVDF